MKVNSGVVTTIDSANAGVKTVVFGDVDRGWQVDCTLNADNKKLALNFENKIAELERHIELEADVNQTDFDTALAKCLDEVNVVFDDIMIFKKNLKEFRKSIKEFISSKLLYFVLSTTDGVHLYIGKTGKYLLVRAEEDYNKSGVFVSADAKGENEYMFTPFKELFATGSMDIELLKEKLVDQFYLGEASDEYFEAEDFETFSEEIERVYSEIE